MSTAPASPPDTTAAEADCDLLIVGGGINGAGIARDAAQRGLRVCLVERDDLAAHTSQASSKLIHGGLRYLEHYEFRLVGEALAEREVLLRIAPHLIRPLQFVLPHEPHLRPRWMLRAGLFLYDRLGGWSGQRQTLPRSFATRLAPDAWGAGLKPQFDAGFVYSDAQVDDARLVVENARAAHTLGARIEIGTALHSARRDGVHWLATLQRADGRQHTLRARALVNAAGPWVKTLLQQIDTPPTRETVRHIKGSHLIVPRVHDQPHAYILQNRDRRIVFVIPYLERFSLIGTTDVAVEQYEHPTISDDETDYLLALANTYLARPLTRADLIATYAGVRPLYDDGGDNPSAITRDYTLRLDNNDGGAPLLNIYGGKITTYRKLAEHALEQLAPHLPGLPRHGHSDQPLQPGLSRERLQALQDELAARIDDPAYARTLTQRYGLRAAELLDASGGDLGERFEHQLSEAEIHYLRDHEWAHSAAAILERRSKARLLLSPAALARAERAIEQALRTAPPTPP